MRNPNRLEQIESSIYGLIEHLKEKDNITLYDKALSNIKLREMLDVYEELKTFYNGSGK